jgi:hypothetical protein
MLEVGMSLAVELGKYTGVTQSKYQIRPKVESTKQNMGLYL